MQDLLLEKQDLTHLSWSKIRNSSGTAGSFLKSYSDLGPTKTYYKLSNYDSFRGIIGHECVNELIADRLLTVLNIPHLSYRLIHADVLLGGETRETWLCASDDFKLPGETKLSLDVYYQAERKPEETPLDFCVRNGWSNYLYEMLLVDFLLLNRDRHGANLEVLRNKSEKSIRLAPLFDHGLSLFCSCQSLDEVLKTDVMEDKAVQSFIGGRSAMQNLQLIPPGEEPKVAPLKESDKMALLEGLDAILPSEWLDAIWNMIWSRWNYYESFCHSRR